MKRTLTAIALLLFVLGLSQAAAAAGRNGYYRYPAIHGDTIVFTSEGDLWTVDVKGGPARRLTSHEGMETYPAISPDGLTLAFSAQYEGPTEVYTMPLAGGLPSRRSSAGRRTARSFIPPEDIRHCPTLSSSCSTRRRTSRPCCR